MYPIKPRSRKSGPRKTYAYGVRDDGYIAGVHTGTDFAGPKPGDRPTVRATKGGRVVTIGYDGSYGNYVVVRCRTKGGSIRYVWYCHLSSVYRNLYEGRVIHTGQIIGKVGKTGNATAEHLHYEERGESNRYADHRAPVFITSQRPPARLRALGWR